MNEGGSSFEGNMPVNKKIKLEPSNVKQIISTDVNPGIHIQEPYCSAKYDESTSSQFLNRVPPTLTTAAIHSGPMQIHSQPLDINKLHENIDSTYSMNMSENNLWPLLSECGAGSGMIYNQTADKNLAANISVLNPISPVDISHVLGAPLVLAENQHSADATDITMPSLDLDDSSSLDISYLLSTPAKKTTNPAAIGGPTASAETLNTPQKDTPELNANPLRIADIAPSDRPAVVLFSHDTPPNRRLAPKPSSNSKILEFSPLLKKYRKLSPKNTPTKLKFILPKQRQIKIRRQVLKSKPSKEIHILPLIVAEPEEILATPLPDDAHKESEIDQPSDKNSLGDEVDDVLGEDEDLEDDEDNVNTQREEHLAALFKASSTIAEKRQNERRNSGGHKLNKQQRRLQTRISALTPSESDQDNTNAALDFLKKAKEVLLEHPSVFDNLICALQEVDISEGMPEHLYLKVAQILEGFPVVINEFIMFLKPHQAMRVGKYKEYSAGLRLRNFVQKLQHLSDQHQVQIQKLVKVIQVMQNLNASSDDIDEMKTKMAPILRYPDLLESFALCFSSEPPPPCLASDYEEMLLDSPGTPDSCEHINLLDEDQSTSPDRPCCCRCHSSQSPSQVKQNHCRLCGVRFIDGRVYIHSGRTLRPAKVTYLVNKDKEKGAAKVNAKAKNARRLKNSQGNKEPKS